MKSLKINFLSFIVTAIMLTSCVEKTGKNEMNLLSFTNAEKIGCDSSNNYSNFFNNLLSYDGGLMSFREINGKVIFAGISIGYDSVIIYEPAINKRKAFRLPFKGKLPLALLYFHNYDSVFVFMDRLYTKRLKNDYGIEIADFYLINGEGKIKNSYYFDSVPNIDNPLDSNRLMLNKAFVPSVMIRKNKIYLPFHFYKPDEIYKNFKTKLLCEYDLKTKKLRMLDIYVEPNYFISDTRLNPIMTMNYIFLNDTEIIYFFSHIPMLFKYNLKTGKSEKLNSEADFPYFVNKASNIKIEYRQLKYAEKDHIFMRNVVMENIINHKKAYFDEYFNSNFELMGFSVSVQPNSPNIYVSKGYLSERKDSIGGYKCVYHVMVSGSKKISMQDWDSIFNLNTFSQKTDNSKFIFRQPLPLRVLLYANSMGVEDNERIVCINIDHSCSSTISFLIKTLNNPVFNANEKKLGILIYSEDTMLLSMTEKKFIKINKWFIYDKKRLFKNYLNDNEFDKQFVFIKQKNGLEYFSEYTCDNFQEIFTNLILK